MSTEPVVYIVDDDEPVCKALAFFLKSVGIRAQTYKSADEFLYQVSGHFDGCLVLDVCMPGMSGIELQNLLCQRGIDTPVLIMTGNGDVEMAVQAMKAGAVDFIEKPFENSLFLDRVKRCIKISEDKSRLRSHRQGIEEQLARLTPREREVMDMLVAGHINKVIAAKLNISIRTVEVHRSRIMEKLDASTLSDIIRMALSLSHH